MIEPRGPTALLHALAPLVVRLEQEVGGGEEGPSTEVGGHGGVARVVGKSLLGEDNFAPLSDKRKLSIHEYVEGLGVPANTNWGGAGMQTEWCAILNGGPGAWAFDVRQGGHMTEDEALVAAALAVPEDRTPRLVLADWLDEHGQSEQGEVIRARCSLAVLPTDDPGRAALLAREGLLCERHLEDWVEVCDLPLTWTQALAMFRRRLSETAAWCGRHDGRLWTPELDPSQTCWVPSYPRDPTTLLSRTTSERQATVNHLANERARLLTASGIDVPDEGTPEGRLLVFYPDVTLSDGASGSESDWFFDVDNVPAWDTWVWVTQDNWQGADPLSYNSCLVCWVPPALVDRAHAGIRVNPEECIRWAVSMSTALTRRLSEAGLLT